ITNAAQADRNILTHESPAQRHGDRVDNAPDERRHTNDPWKGNDRISIKVTTGERLGMARRPIGLLLLQRPQPRDNSEVLRCRGNRPLDDADKVGVNALEVSEG